MVPTLVFIVRKDRRRRIVGIQTGSASRAWRDQVWVSRWDWRNGRPVILFFGTFVCCLCTRRIFRMRRWRSWRIIARRRIRSCDECPCGTSHRFAWTGSWRIRSCTECPCATPCRFGHGSWRSGSPKLVLAGTMAFASSLMFANGSEGGTRFGAKELVKLGWRFGCALRLVLAQALLLALDFGDEGGNALLNRGLNAIVDDVSRHLDVAIEQFAMDLLKVNSRRDTHRRKFTDLEFMWDEAHEERQRHLVGILLAKLHGTSLRRTRLGTLVLGAARLFARGFGAGPTTGLRVGVALAGGARLVLHRGDMGRTGTTTVRAIVFLSRRMNLRDHRPSVGRWTSLRLGLGPL